MFTTNAAPVPSTGVPTAMQFSMNYKRFSNIGGGVYRLTKHDGTSREIVWQQDTWSFMKNALHSIQLDKIYRWAFMCVCCIDVYQLLGKQFIMIDIDLAPTDTEPTEAGTYIVEF